MKYHCLQLDNIFAILHQTLMDYSLIRTSWRMIYKKEKKKRNIEEEGVSLFLNQV